MNLIASASSLQQSASLIFIICWPPVQREGTEINMKRKSVCVWSKRGVFFYKSDGVFYK